MSRSNQEDRTGKILIRCKGRTRGRDRRPQLDERWIRHSLQIGRPPLRDEIPRSKERDVWAFPLDAVRAPKESTFFQKIDVQAGDVLLSFLPP